MFLTSSEMQLIARQELGLLPSLSTGGSGVTTNTRSIVNAEVAAESARCALWALSREGTTPVYISRWLSLTGRIARPAFSSTLGEEESDSVLRGVVADLESLGDVASVGNGYWVPAPIRVVALHNEEEGKNQSWLLIGSVPTSRFPEEARLGLEHRGAARFWCEDPTKWQEAMGCCLARQNEAAWRSDPTGDVEQLRAWTQRILNTSLSPLGDYEAEFEAYAPGVRALRDSNHPFQFKRWTTELERLPNGRFLMRRRSRWGMTEPRIGRIERGKLVEAGTLALEGGDLRRLLYGLDVLAVNPTQARTRAAQAEERLAFGNGAHVFRLGNEVPRSENRLLLAVGTLRSPSDPTRYYPREWIVPARHVEVVRRAFVGLGVPLETREF